MENANEQHTVFQFFFKSRITLKIVQKNYIHQVSCQDTDNCLDGKNSSRYSNTWQWTSVYVIYAEFVTIMG